MDIDWLVGLAATFSKEIAFIQADPLKSLIGKYSDVFSSDLGTIQGVPLDICVCKARSVPYSLKEKIKKELDRLVAQEIIQPVLFSDQLCQW